MHRWFLEVRHYLVDNDLAGLLSEMEFDVSGSPAAGLPMKKYEVIHAVVKTTHLLKILKLRE